MKNGYLRLSTIACLFLSACVQADVKFGFSLNVPAPVYPTYIPPVYVAAPIIHRLYIPQPEPQPSLGFSVDTDTFGFNINVPLSIPERVKRDTYGHSYWDVYNNTDVTITFINDNGERVVIPSGCTRKVNHRTGFTFTVLGDGQRFRARSINHYLTVEFDHYERLTAHSQ